MSRPLPPLARAAVLVAAGLLLGLRFPGIGTAGAVAPAIVLLGLVALARSRSARGPGQGVWAVLVLAAIALGSATASAARTDCRARLPDGARLRVHGVLDAELPRGTGGTVVLDDARLAGGHGLLCRGRVSVTGRALRGVARPRGPGVHGAAAGLSGAADPKGAAADRSGGRAAALHAGVGVEAWGRWRVRQAAGFWPRRPERAGYVALDSVRVLRSGTGWHPLLELRGAAQRRLRRLLPARAGMAEALLLARREGLGAETRERFVRAGLAHVLAISGLHVGVVAAAMLGLARLLRMAPVIGAGTAAAGTLLYVGFLGAPYAASRAALQIVLLLATRFLQRPSDPLALIAAAALGLLILDPLSLLDPGFQLSFAGATAMATLRRPVAVLLPRRLPGSIRDGLAASVAATVLTGPIAALHFAQAAPVGILANLAAVPVVAFVVPALALALCVAPVWAGPGHFLAGGAGLGLSLLDRVADTAGRMPFGHGPVSSSAAVGWALATTAGLVVLGTRRRWPLGALRPAVRRVVAVGLALTLGFAWPAWAGMRRDGALEIDAIDVGQGDAIAIRSPRGRWILVDAGPRSASYDAGAARVVPFLRRQGARTLSLLVLTHPDADHIGGAESVLREVGARAVLEPAVAVGHDLYRAALTVADSEGSRWYRAVVGDTLRLDDLLIQVLAPPDTAIRDPTATNEYSVVLRVVYGRFAVLLEGDAPTDVEQGIVRAALPGSLRAQVLKVGHHGSATSTGEALLDASAPAVALVSVGRHNRYGHPDPTVLDRLRRHDVEIFRTDRQGTIRVLAWADGRFSVEPSRPAAPSRQAGSSRKDGSPRQRPPPH